jgi:hypothetical protein
MKSHITFTLSNLSEAFYEGTEGGAIKGINHMTDAERLAYLIKFSTNGTGGVKMKIGSSNQFRDRVDANSLIKNPKVKIEYKLEPRKGYKLVTFDLSL